MASIIQSVTLTRAQDWPERLEAFLRQRRNAPFQWGLNDCVLFAADWVFDATGHDAAADFRSTYEDAEGALRLARSLGGLDEIATAALGAPILWQRASKGDIVLAKFEDRENLAVCDGAYLAGPGLDELRYLPMARHAMMAWRVGGG